MRMKTTTSSLLLTFIVITNAAELRPSRLDGKMISKKMLKSKRADYMGLIEEYNANEKTWKPICTAFLVTKNVAASAGSCISRIVEKNKLYEDFRVQFDRNEERQTRLDNYPIMNVFLYKDTIYDHGEDTIIYDIGLILIDPKKSTINAGCDVSNKPILSIRRVNVYGWPNPIDRVTVLKDGVLQMTMTTTPNNVCKALSRLYNFTFDGRADVCGFSWSDDEKLTWLDLGSPVHSRCQVTGIITHLPKYKDEPIIFTRVHELNQFVNDVFRRLRKRKLEN